MTTIHRYWIEFNELELTSNLTNLKQFYERTDETGRRFSTPCPPGHLWYRNIQYDEERCTYNIPSLAERRFELYRTFFQKIIRDKSNVLWYLLPTRRDSELTARLRCVRQYPTIYARTNHYKNSIIVY